jgi:hypothetical protein
MDSIELNRQQDPKYGKYDNPIEGQYDKPIEEPMVDTEPMTLVKEEMPENITFEEEPNQIIDEKPLPPVVPVIQNEPVSQSDLLVEKPKTRRTRRKSNKTKTVTQKKRKRCKKGSRRNRKTKRCRRKCEPGYKKNKSNRCVKA